MADIYLRYYHKANPDGLGRLQVELKGFPTPITTPWLRQMVPHATAQGGTGGLVLIPEVGDQVVLLSPTYGADMCVEDLSAMIILGSLYHGNAAAAYVNDDGENITKQLQTKAGNLLQISDEADKETITIQCKDDKTSIILAAETPSITITAGDATVTIGKDDKGAVDITTKGAISIKSDDAISLNGKEVKIDTASADVTITAKGNVKLDSKGTADVKASGKVTIKGASVEIG